MTVDKNVVVSDDSARPLIDIDSLNPPPPYQTQTQPGPVDVLRTRIPVPKNVTIPHPKVGPSGSPKENEEDVVSHFVHASCRLYEALLVTTDVCNDLIYKWTGREPQAADQLARIVVATHDKNTNKMDPRLKALAPEAVALQIALSAIQLLVTVAGVAMGKMVDCRTEGVADGRLLPLSALASEDPSPEESQTEPNEESNEEKDQRSYTAKTFAAFTNGAKASDSIVELLKCINYIRNPIGDAVHFLGRWTNMMAFTIIHLDLNIVDHQPELLAIHKAALEMAEPGKETTSGLLKVFKDHKEPKISPRKCGQKVTSDHKGDRTSPITNQLAFNAQQLKSLVELAMAVTKKVRKSALYRHEREPAETTPELLSSKKLRKCLGGNLVLGNIVTHRPLRL